MRYLQGRPVSRMVIFIWRSWDVIAFYAEDLVVFIFFCCVEVLGLRLRSGDFFDGVVFF